MKDKKLRIVNYGIAIFMLVVIAILYPRLPEQIPTQWQFNGTPNYSPKKEIWVIGGMFVIFAFLFDYLPYIDPRRKNYQKFGRIYDFFCVGIQIFLAIMAGIMLSESFYPGRIQAVKVIFALLSLLFLLAGNYLPKLQSNFYMGIKTPWTLSNDEVWRKTHRLAGKLYVGCGILTLISDFLFPVPVAGSILFMLILGSTAVVTLASYLWWRQIEVEE